MNRMGLFDGGKGFPEAFGGYLVPERQMAKVSIFLEISKNCGAEKKYGNPEIQSVFPEN